MWEHPLVRSIIKFVQIALLAALVVLGIVFMPDDFVTNVKAKTAGAGQIFQTEVVGRWPAISRDLDQKFDATTAEIQKWYQIGREKFSATVGDWVYEKLNGKPR
jgi:hypothetical protein